MRNLLIAATVLLCPLMSAQAQIGVSVVSPGVSIGIDLPVYPALVQVPDYPVYYAPQLDSNYFFYNGQYWVYQGDNWYSSAWYNGPWQFVLPTAVPLFILRIPVRYYRRPPSYFNGWAIDAPPLWGQHWGPQWQAQRRGWDQWNRSNMPRPAPLPVYQQQYSGARYPHSVAQQNAVRAQHGNAQSPNTPPATGQTRQTQPLQHLQPYPQERQQTTVQTRQVQQAQPPHMQQRSQAAPQQREEEMRAGPQGGGEGGGHGEARR